jgi:predicted nucleic acid-binding protein
MGTAVKKTISLPPDLVKDAERIAREEGKTLSAVVQDALRLARRERLLGEWKAAQGYWSARAREKGLLREEDLDLRDDPDNRILECAVAGEADAVVTGDKAILALGEFRGIRLLSLSVYLAGN